MTSIAQKNYLELEKKLTEYIDYNKNLTHYQNGSSFRETRPPIWIDIKKLSEEIVPSYPQDIQELTQQMRNEFIEVAICNYTKNCNEYADKHFYYLEKTNTQYGLNNLLTKLDLSNVEIRIQINEPDLLKNVECGSLCLYYDYECFECINSIRKVDKIFITHSYMQRAEHVPFMIDALDQICHKRQIYIQYQVLRNKLTSEKFKELINQCSCVREMTCTDFEFIITYSCD